MPGSGALGNDDTQVILTELNDMWDRWSVDEGLIYAVIANQYPLVAYQQSYSLGPGSGADWAATQVPSRIYGGAIVSAVPFSATTVNTSKVVLVADTTGLQIGMTIIGLAIPDNSTITQLTANTSIVISNKATASNSGISMVATGLNRNELKIVDSTQYLNHNDLGAAAATPEEIYPKYSQDSSGNIRISVWPVVNEIQNSYLELEVAVPFSTWALPTNYNVPPGYRDLIVWATAFRCLAPFGIAVDSQVGQIVALEGQKAEAAIREMNARNRQLPAPAVMTPAAQVSPQPAGVR